MKLKVFGILFVIFSTDQIQCCCNHKDCIDGVYLQPNKQTIFVHQNDNVTVDCISGPAASGNDHSFLKWKFSYQSSLYNNSQSISLPDLHFSDALCDIEKLVIKGFQKFNEGIYSCERVASNTSMERNSDVIKKDINIRMIEPFKPKISMNQKTLNVLSNTKAILSCNAIGSPLPILQWFQDTILLKTCKESPCNISLLVDLNQTFFCYAENIMGITKQQFDIVRVEEPELIENYHSVNDMHLTCTVKRTYPIPTIYWQYQICNEKCSIKNDWLNVTKRSAFSVESELFTSTLNIKERPLYAHVRCIAYNAIGNSTNVYKVALSESIITESNLVVIIGVAGAAFLLLLIAVIVFIVHKRLRNKYARFMSPYSDYQVKTDINLMDQGLHLPYDMSWEYPRNKLEFIKVLGSGAFGQVWLARAVYIHHYHYYKAETFNNTIGKKRRLSLYEYMKRTSRNNNNKTNETDFVAVKTLKNGASDTEYKDLASEIKVLIHIGKHKNIVNLLGACTRNDSLFAIMEYCPYGDLKSFLKSKRSLYSKEWTTYLNQLSEQIALGDLCTMAYQIAKGMSFLHSKNLIHRDLASRNILLGDRYCIKISDFGLARSIEIDENYVKTTGGLLPVKWMSPESLIDRVYNTKTDVWSFAISMWEIYTLGGSPYPGVAVELLFDYVYGGNRMPQPESCPNEMFDIMKECWSQVPSERPEFIVIAEKIKEILQAKIQENFYLKEIGEYDHQSVRFSQDIENQEHSTMKRGSKKFSLAGLADFMAQRTWRPLSHSEDHLLSSRLSSANSDVFDNKTP